MSAINEVLVSAPAREVHDYLRKVMEHVELVSEDVFEMAGDYVAVILYQQYFMRAKNRAALMLLVAGGGSETRVKSVATGSSGGLVFDFDWGAAGAFAAEPIDRLKERFETRDS